MMNPRLPRILVVLAFTIGLTLGSAASAAPAVKATELTGSWKATGMGFAEITLDADGSFSTFLHQRPFDSGTWKLAGDVLTLAGQGNGTVEVKALRRSGANLTGAVDGKPVRWTPIKPPARPR